MDTAGVIFFGLIMLGIIYAPVIILGILAKRHSTILIVCTILSTLVVLGGSSTTADPVNLAMTFFSPFVAAYVARGIRHGAKAIMSYKR